MMQDTYRHKGMRMQLIVELQARGITDERVLEVMGVLPRHYFLDKAFEEWAYQDKAFPIGNEQTISQPYTVAYMTALLDVQKREKVLEIGTGSGYQAAVLAMLGARVFTVERQEALYLKTRNLLQQLGVGSIRCFLRDGTLGVAEFAPFEKIIVTAGTPSVPEPLKNQLAIGGKMVVPIGNDFGQKMHLITRHDVNDFEVKIYDDFKFVPFLKGINKHKQ